jgi:lipopolysaccharide export system ATP-binding protein
MSDFIEVDSIRKSFGTKQVLTDIYLRCQTGDVIGLLGRNGIGKSTLLKIMFGTLYTDYKHIRINDSILDQPYKTKNKIAFLSQDKFLPGNLTINQVTHLFNGQLDQKKFLNDEVLSPIINTRIRNLSGGESRYLEVKLILSLESVFVLLDEPFNGISPLHIDLIKKMIHEHSVNKGIILTDHDYRNVLDAANKYYLLFDGGIKKITTKQDLTNWGYLPEISRPGNQ